MNEQKDAGVEHASSRAPARTLFAIRLSWRGKDWEIATDRVPLKTVILPEGARRWGSFGAGAVFQFLILAILLLIPLLFPDRVVQFHQYLATEIAPTSPVVSAWQPVRRRRVKLAVPLPKPPELTIPWPAIPSPIPVAPVVRQVKRTMTVDVSKLASKPPVPLPLSAAPIPNLRRPVQVGSFGEGAGLTETSLRRSSVQTGNFDGPSGPGSLGSATRGAVREGLFQNGEASASSSRPTRRVQASPPSKPVEILFKPKPKYTTAALSKKIEGDVLLEVLFSASGEVKVLRLIRGLGYGLNDSAEEAARHIRFRPARNGAGDPIDSTAEIHIVFELAY